METYVLRLWLPDRPGALGAVASRIGSVKGDVIGIEILETGDAQAVDELVVRLPDSTLVDLLVTEVRQVDEVHVEQIRQVDGSYHDPRRTGLESAVLIVEADDREALVESVVRETPRLLASSWVALVDLEARTALGRSESAPSDPWLTAFVHGASSAVSLGGSDAGASDVVSAVLPDSDLALVVGRERIAWRDRERRHLDALARMVAVRWNELPARSQQEPLSAV